ncbi:MAG TPA: SycD/LcrH family type III secretion system chaperone [Parachlamydiaceae bacterium]|nr:SycD/LcrH family type III secretion system chaperone [Parachlamydiaceae bacterium]
MEIDDLIKQSVDKFSKKYPEIDPEEGKAVLTKIMKDHMSPKDAMGFNPDFFESVYVIAYNLFQAGKYEEATGILRLLVFFDPKNAAFSMALASSLHKQKEYMEAIQSYIATTLLDKATPFPFFHASDCFLKENNLPGAIIMLKMMLKRIANQPKYAALKEKAELSISSLEKELVEKRS